MFSTRSRLLVAALAVLLSLSTAPLAAAEGLSGTVQQVNASEGTLTLRFVEGTTVTFTAPTALLNDLYTGDAVEVWTSGQRVTRLYMKGAAPQIIQPGGTSQRPGFGGPVVPPRVS
jgi:hypothetical protein